MARAVDRLSSIDPLRCRSSVAQRYDVSVTVAGYEQAYRLAIETDGARKLRFATGFSMRRSEQSPTRRFHDVPIGARDEVGDGA